MKPVKKESPNDGVGLTWDDGTPLTTREGKAWWAGWEEGNDDGRADMEEEMRDEIERLREALRALVIAVEYKGPPVDFGEGNLCWEARVPLAFVDKARAALGEGKE